MPLFVIKTWEGKTLIHQLGFPSRGGDKAVARWVEKAVKENGPVTPPKAFKPLIKAMEKAEKHLAKKRPGNAWKEFQKVIKLGANERTFPEGPPALAKKAAEMSAGIVEEATAAIDEALAGADEDPAAALKALRALRSPYGAIPDIKARLTQEIDALK